MTRSPAIRVIGIDPGSIKCGIAVVERRGNQLIRVHSETLNCGRGEFSVRLERIYAQVHAVCVEHRPTAGAIEGLFHQRYADAAMKLGHARAAAILAMRHNQLEVSEIAPTQVKKSVGAYGAAGKEQIRSMVKLLLSIQESPGLDESDALAISIAWHHHNPILPRRVL